MVENFTQHDAKAEVGFTSENKPYFRGELRGPLSPIVTAFALAIVAGAFGLIFKWSDLEASVFALVATFIIGYSFFPHNWKSWYGRFMPPTILGNDTQFNAQPNMQSQNNHSPISFGWPSLLKEGSGGSSRILHSFSYPNVDVQVPWESIDLYTQQIGKLLQEFQRRGEEISVDLLPSLKLTKPIHPRLSYDKEGKQFIVDHTELDVYGAGSDEWKAIEDFKSTLEDAYYNLKKDQKSLGPRLKEQWQYFQQIIKESRGWL